VLVIMGEEEGGRGQGKLMRYQSNTAAISSVRGTPLCFRTYNCVTIVLIIVLQLCYSCVTVVLQLCYSCIRLVLQGCFLADSRQQTAENREQRADSIP
jgi:hypothetical protein